MDIVDIVALLVVLAATFGSVNALFLRLPQAIGILVVALLASLAVMAVDTAAPGLGMAETVRGLIAEIEFSTAVLEGMLGILLFAGALHVNIADLRRVAPTVLMMATLGVVLSTGIVGFGIALVTGMPLIVALVFGALISPTDPVAVLGVLKQARMPRRLETKIAGESLFNDGVGYVVFLFLAGLAFSGDGHGAGISDAAQLFIQEAGGGAVLGAVLGWVTFRLMRQIDDFALEVLITLALVLGGYSLAVALHLSGPIFAVVAGLFIGEVGVKHAMSEATRTYVDAFWKLADEILNSVLFLLIGVEIFAITLGLSSVWLGGVAIMLALLGRLAAVAVPILSLRPFRDFGPGTIPIMTWGGLKGGISVALALSLPESAWRADILTMTYIVVIFSIIVQGLTIAPLARRLAGTTTPD